MHTGHHPLRKQRQGRVATGKNPSINPRPRSAVSIIEFRKAASIRVP